MYSEIIKHELLNITIIFQFYNYLLFDNMKIYK